MDISFRLESFEGPLDLLLHLIEKNKMDIYNIQISTITDQYMAYIAQMGKDADVMSEFLVMAATLLDIKSRMLLPKQQEDEENEEDPRQELVQPLLEYKMYKYMSYELKDRAIEASKTLYKASSIPEEVSSYSAPIDLDVFLNGLTAARLKDVFDDVIKRSDEKINRDAEKYRKISRENISLPDRLSYIKRYTTIHRSFSFRKLIEKQATRENIIVTFLAVLELMKNGQLVAVQNGENDIMMYDPASVPEEMLI